MIAIESKKDLLFPPSYRGKVTMKIDIIINRPDLGIYEMRITDTCTKMVQKQVPVLNASGLPTGQQETKNVLEPVGKPVIRFKTMTYAELDALANGLDITIAAGNMTENFNNLFRKGLLVVTQQECQKGEGMYFSEAADWKIKAAG